MVESNLAKSSGPSYYLRFSNYFHTRRRDYDYYDDYDRGYPPRHYDDRRGYDRRDDYYDREMREPAQKKSSSGGTSAGSVISVIIRILLIVFIILFFTMPQFEPYRQKFYDYLMAGLYKYQEVPDSAEFSVERIFTIESDGELDYTLYIPIPQDFEIDGEEAQKLKSYNLDPMYSELEETEHQWIWHGSFDNPDKATIKITYHFRTAKIKWDISIGKSGIIDDIPSNVLNRYGGDAWPVADFEDTEGVDTDSDGIPDVEDVDDDNNGLPDKYRIEPSNTEIRSLLIEILNTEGFLTGSDLSQIGDLNVYKVVDAIYDHIDKTCSYPTPQEAYQDSINYGSYPKWATGTYADKRGDCDDQSILFISLCRAAGIPAMLEIGALYDPNMIRWEGHGWANVYIPYKEKYHAEKGIDHVMPMVDIVNDIFLFRDPNRFSEWVDDGVPGRLDSATGEWQLSHLEKRYLAWEYIRGDSSVDVDIQESYNTLEFKAFPPEEKLYI